MTIISSPQSIFFYILVRSWRSFYYFDRCVESILHQSYKKYRILYVDDCSGYNRQQKDYIRNKLKNHTVVFNKIRKYSVRNAYEIINKYATNNYGVIFNVDGDDWLYHKDVLSAIAQTYKKTGCWLTYGGCLNFDGIRYFDPTKRQGNYDNTPYAAHTIRNRLYRQEPFRPLHPRTWKVWLYKKISKSSFLRSDGSWLQTCEDLAMFFPMMEMAGKRCLMLKKYLYIYNIANPQNDSRVNKKDILLEEEIIRKKKIYVRLL